MLKISMNFDFLESNNDLVYDLASDFVKFRNEQDNLFTILKVLNSLN